MRKGLPRRIHTASRRSAEPGKSEQLPGSDRHFKSRTRPSDMTRGCQLVSGLAGIPGSSTTTTSAAVPASAWRVQMLRHCNSVAVTRGLEGVHVLGAANSEAAGSNLDLLKQHQHLTAPKHLHIECPRPLSLRQVAGMPRSGWQRFPSKLQSPRHDLPHSLPLSCYRRRLLVFSLVSSHPSQRSSGSCFEEADAFSVHPLLGLKCLFGSLHGPQGAARELMRAWGSRISANSSYIHRLGHGIVSPLPVQSLHCISGTSDQGISRICNP